MRSCYQLLVCFAWASLLVLAVFGAAHAKRTPPPKVPPVVVGATEYRVASEQIREGGKPTGLRALVVAQDVKTQKDLWKAEVYTIHYKADLETDVQDVHIKSLEAEGKILVATDEKGNVFHIDPATQKVTPGK